VSERALQNISDDFHIAVRMGAEAVAGLDVILVNNAQAAELRVFGVVVIGKRKGISGVQPAVVGLAALFSRTQGNQGRPPFKNNRCFNVKIVSGSCW